MQQRVASLTAAGQQDTAQKETDTAASFIIVSTLILSVPVLLWAAAGNGSLPPLFLMLTAIVLLFKQLYSLALGVLTGKSKLQRVGSAEIVASVCNFVLSIALTLPFGVTGLLLAQSGWSIISLLLLRLTRQFSFKIRWDLDSLGNVARLGLAYTINGFLLVLLKNTGRLAVAIWGSPQLLGLFGLCILVLGYAELTFSALTRAMVSTLFSTSASEPARQAIRRHLEAWLALLSTAVPVLSLGVALLAPLAIRTILPRYTASTTAVQVICLALNPMAARYLLEPYFYATRRRRLLFSIEAVGGGLALTLSLPAALSSTPLLWLAAVSVGGYAAVSSAVVFVFHRSVGRPAWLSVKRTVEWALPTLIVAGVLGWVERVPLALPFHAGATAILAAVLLLLSEHNRQQLLQHG